MTNFKGFVESFPPEYKGDAIGGSEEIRNAHNSFSRPDPFVAEEAKDDKGGEAFHFVAYVPVAGRVYELDGLTKGPVDLGAAGEGGNWCGPAREEIQRRMAELGDGELRYTLLAVVKSRKELAEVGEEEGEEGEDEIFVSNGKVVRRRVRGWTVEEWGRGAVVVRLRAVRRVCNGARECAGRQTG